MRVAVFIICLMIVGCAPPPKSVDYFEVDGYHVKCLRGVAYWRIGRGQSPAYKKDGTLYLCRRNKAGQLELLDEAN